MKKASKTKKKKKKKSQTSNSLQIGGADVLFGTANLGGEHAREEINWGKFKENGKKPA